MYLGPKARHVVRVDVADMPYEEAVARVKRLKAEPQYPATILEDIPPRQLRVEEWESLHRCPGCGATKVAPDFSCAYCGRLRRDLPDGEIWGCVTRLQEYISPPVHVPLFTHGQALRAQIRRLYGI